MMGSGKSTIGPLLAQRLRRTYVDSDWEIERRTGLEVAELFDQRGEAAARDVEHRVLVDALAERRLSVIGTGGGVITRTAGRDALRRGPFVVWLRAAPATLARRVGDGEGRPLLQGTDVGQTLARLCRERRPLYEEVADVAVDVDVLAAEGAVAAALAAGAGR